MKNFELELSRKAYKKIYKLIEKNKGLRQAFSKVFEILAKDPFDLRIKSHKANTKYAGLVYSSRVNGDIRIIWQFDNKKIIIYILDVGGHSGNNKVYK